MHQNTEKILLINLVDSGSHASQSLKIISTALGKELLQFAKTNEPDICLFHEIHGLIHINKSLLEQGIISGDTLTSNQLLLLFSNCSS